MAQLVDVTCGVSHTALARLTLPLTAGEPRDAGLRVLAALDAARVPAVLWTASTPAGESVAPSLVLCAHKTNIARVFKLVYTQQAALGVQLSPDIKCCVTLKVLMDGQLQVAQAAGLARALEAEGWNCLGRGWWVRLVAGGAGLLAATEHGGTQAVHAVRCTLYSETTGSDSSSPRIRLSVLHAGLASFAPFAAAQRVGVRGGPLPPAFIADAGTLRRAGRALFNAPCIVLPHLTPVLVKGLRVKPSHPDDLAAWCRVSLPGHPDAAAVAEEPVLEVSTASVITARDPGADSGDAGVWEVPLGACWAPSGLTLAPTADHEQAAACSAFMAALSGGSALSLWYAQHVQVVAPAAAAPALPGLLVPPSTSWWAAAGDISVGWERLHAALACNACCDDSGAAQLAGPVLPRSPRVAAILAARRDTRAQEQEAWRGLKAELEKRDEGSTGDGEPAGVAPRLAAALQVSVRRPSAALRPPLPAKKTKTTTATAAPTAPAIPKALRASLAGGVPALAVSVGGLTSDTQPTSRKRSKPAELDLVVIEAKVAAMATASASVSGLSVAELQAWLRARKLIISGKKATLEARVAATLGLPMPAASASGAL